MGAPDNGFSLNTTDNVRYCADRSVLVAILPKGGGELRVWREKNRAWHRSFLTMEFERDNVANSYLQMAGILLGAHVLLVLLWICPTRSSTPDVCCPHVGLKSLTKA
jgi:hypothetical protein